MNDIILWEQSPELSSYSQEFISSQLYSKDSSNVLLSFSEKGIFSKLYHNDEIFKDKSEHLQTLSKEVQDIRNMTSSEKEMFISHFKVIPKSNIYKNILRSFNRFMISSNNHISIECIDINNKDITLIRKQYQKFLKDVSFPEMIYRIIKNQRYSKFFYYYLQDFFLDDLYAGNFKQLRDHFIASIFFLICLSDPIQIESIKFHKK